MACIFDWQSWIWILNNDNDIKQLWLLNLSTIFTRMNKLYSLALNFLPNLFWRNFLYSLFTSFWPFQWTILLCCSVIFLVQLIVEFSQTICIKNSDQFNTYYAQLTCEQHSPLHCLQWNCFLPSHLFYYIENFASYSKFHTNSSLFISSFRKIPEFEVGFIASSRTTFSE